MEQTTTIDERFEAMHKAHPEIYETFKKVIKDIQARGFERWSADGVFHIIRFTTGADGRDIDKYKCNNDYVSRYARMYVADHPEHKDFFSFRTLKSA